MSDKTWMKCMEIGAKLGCHQMPERSFCFKGYQFPVCARCTGVIISSIVATIVFFKKKLSYVTCILMSGVMLGDWLIQYFNIKESTNKRRFITGLIGGFGYSMLHLYFYRFIFNRIRHLFKTGN